MKVGDIISSHGTLYRIFKINNRYSLLNLQGLANYSFDRALGCETLTELERNLRYNNSDVRVVEIDWKIKDTPKRCSGLNRRVRKTERRTQCEVSGGRRGGYGNRRIRDRRKVNA